MANASGQNKSGSRLEEEPRGCLGLGSSARLGEGSGSGTQAGGLLDGVRLLWAGAGPPEPRPRQP